MTVATVEERQAFLDAIIAEPEDDALRLTYADWIDERGESERAKFIRWMIANPDGHFQPFRDCVEMAFRFVNDPVRQHWNLLDDNRDRFWPFDYGLYLNTAWHRGFCNIVEWDWEDWNAHADEIARQHPIEEVRLLDRVRFRSFEDQATSAPYIYHLHGRKNREAIYDVIPPYGVLVKDLLKLNWPRIKFILPEAS